MKNTGIYFPSNDVMALSTSSVERLTIDNIGNTNISGNLTSKGVICDSVGCIGSGVGVTDPLYLNNSVIQNSSQHMYDGNFGLPSMDFNDEFSRNNYSSVFSDSLTYIANLISSYEFSTDFTTMSGSIPKQTSVLISAKFKDATSSIGALTVRGYGQGKAVKGIFSIAEGHSASSTLINWDSVISGIYSYAKNDAKDGDVVGYTGYGWSTNLTYGRQIASGLMGLGYSPTVNDLPAGYQVGSFLYAHQSGTLNKYNNKTWAKWGIGHDMTVGNSYVTNGSYGNVPDVVILDQSFEPHNISYTQAGNMYVQENLVVDKNLIVAGCVVYNGGVLGTCI